MSMVTAENCRRAPAFRKFAEHRGSRGFTFAELAGASSKPSLTELATWISEAHASGYLTETVGRNGVRRYHVAA